MSTKLSFARALNQPQGRSSGQEFWDGVKAVSPLLLGAFPFGLIYGVLALESGLSPVMAQVMSVLLFAGSAQFITTQLVAASVPSPIIMLTIAIVNLRHVLYSASIAPYFIHLNSLWKWGLAYLLTDEAYAVAITRFAQTTQSASPQRHWYFLGTGMALWICWQLSTAIGVFLGAQIPSYWSLDFAVPLTFIAIVIPALKDRPSAAAALVAGAIAVIAFGLPYKLGLVVATLIGIAVGVGVAKDE